jgi:4-aminobutyrate aminotransferase-like enzyme/Ser/Thr protein kinase RdoA (MazF antagonist)
VTLEAQRPALGHDEARNLTRELYGLEAELEPLPSERDQNYRVTIEGGERLVLKISGSDESPEHLALQNEVLGWLAEHDPELRVQRLRPTLAGKKMTVIRGTDGQEHSVRLLTHLPGSVLAGARPHSPALLHDLGAQLARLDRALQGFTHPAAERPQFFWNLERAPQIVRERPESIEDPTRRLMLERVLELWDGVVAPVFPSLRRSVIYNDANDYNVLVSEAGAGKREVTGFIDFGDMLEGPVVCDLAIAVAYAMLGKRHPLAACAQVVEGYNEVFALTEPELEVVFPLACARLAASVSLSAVRRGTEPESDYLMISEAPAWETLERLADVPPTFARNVLRERCGLPPCPDSGHVVQWLERNASEFGPVIEPDPRRVATTEFDLSVASLDLGDGEELAGSPAFSEWVSRQMEERGARIGIGRYDEARMVYTGAAFEGVGEERPEQRTVHLGMDLFLEPGAPVMAPFAGRVHSVRDNSEPLDYGPTVILRHEPAGGPAFHTLYGHLSEDALRLKPGMEIARGDVIARLGAFEVNGNWPPHLHFQIVTDLLDREGEFPGVAAPSERAVWLSLSPNPNLVLQLPGGAAGPDPSERAALLAERRRRLGPNLSLAYDAPLHIVRGRGQFLYDAEGHAYLDCVNNVCHVGHCHPRVVEAARRQTGVLNTNTRYLHENLVRYAERLSATLPDPLDVCYFVCSGSEANELALRMARAHTGRDDLVVLEGAYHGNTAALIDASPYKFDGPGGRGAPPHVHKTVMPDDYRGPYRRGEPDCGIEYAAHVAQAIEQARADGREIAAFFSETLLGCGGQIELPPGYLEAAYGHAREAGALCIADEVQVGFGRVGTHFWGFQTQGVVPDIVTMGKPIGNGHPLGAVVTTREIAASFDTGMEYFNTFGGNPVSCAIGLAVLDVIEDEQLQAHALAVGGYLEDRLAALREEHAVVGDVRGRGLFLGVEFVSDPETRQPATDIAGYVVERLKDHGILTSTDGPDGNVLKLKPPLAFSRADADRLATTLDSVLAEDFVRRR